ncbi:VOC family protein [Mangrovicella endophytica]|uniref:VOC family protein n=1 Tax=Mangrovicella endophytica TaxID=2066697 RepID=UPI001FE07C77|nr:VOC family protein [Mangrovicella endophytica]
MMRLALDHVVLLVADLGAAGAGFEAAGFTVTPTTHHSSEMGTANCCVMLEGRYIELLSVVANTPANAGWRALMAAGGGLRGVALQSDDLNQTSAELSLKGIAAETPRSFSRATGEGELRFSVMRVDRMETPGLQVLYCHHHTSELVWRPQWCRHANGAQSLEAVETAAAPALQRFAGGEGIGLTAGTVDRLRIVGNQNTCHDLRASCGVMVDLVAP